MATRVQGCVSQDVYKNLKTNWPDLGMLLGQPSSKIASIINMDGGPNPRDVT